jgi:hypothetical protein
MRLPATYVTPLTSFFGNISSEVDRAKTQVEKWNVEDGEERYNRFQKDSPRSYSEHLRYVKGVYFAYKHVKSLFTKSDMTISVIELRNRLKQKIKDTQNGSENPHEKDNPILEDELLAEDPMYRQGEQEAYTDALKLTEKHIATTSISIQTALRERIEVREQELQHLERTNKLQYYILGYDPYLFYEVFSKEAGTEIHNFCCGKRPAYNEYRGFLKGQRDAYKTMLEIIEYWQELPDHPTKQTPPPCPHPHPAP